MTEILTESFCERCGTRYTFESARPRARLKGVRVLSRGLKNFVLSDDTSMDEAMAAARSDTDRESTSHQLDAFHKTFNFCMTCRQYTCPNCWNEVEARCLTCAPHLGHEIMPAPFPDLATTELVGAEARFDGANGSNGANDLGYGDVAAVTDAAPSDGEGDFDLAARLDSLTAAAPVTDPNATRRSVREKTTGQTGGLLGRFRPGESLDAELDAFEQDRHAEPPAEPEMVAEAAAEVAAEAEAVAQAEVVVAESEAFNETEIVAPPEVAAEAEPEPVAVTEPQPAIAAEALAGPEPMAQPDAAAELEPEAVADAQAVAEPEIVAEPEPEWVAEAESVGEPEPVAEVAAEPELIAEPEAVGEPEPVAEVAADPEWVAEPDPISAEPEPEPDSPVVDVVPQPTWRMVAPDPAPEVPHTPPPEPGATIPARASAAAPTVEPQWPTRPEWLGDTPAAGLPFLGRAAAPQGGLEALWAESTREVVAPTSGRAAGGVQPCVSCGLSLSANARFCRRCGTSQPT